MSSRLSAFVSTFLIAAGLAGVLGGGLLFTQRPQAEMRLILTIDAAPSAETFAGVVSGSASIAETLEELSLFDTVRERVSASGFGITRQLFSGTPEEQRRTWERLVDVDHLDATLVLRIRARGRTPGEARALAGAVTHVLALETPTLVGGSVVRVRVERMPVLVMGLPMDAATARGIIIAGAVLFLLGALAHGFARTKIGAPEVSPLRPSVTSVGVDRAQTMSAAQASPAREEGRRAEPRPTSEDARFWLQKFLEEHQKTPRTSPRGRENPG